MNVTLGEHTVGAEGCPNTGVILAIDSAQVLALGASIDEFAVGTEVASMGPFDDVLLPIVGRPVQGNEVVSIRFDDGLGAMRVFIEVDAFNNDVVVATGRTDVELVTGTLVPAQVILSTCVAASGPFCDDVTNELVTCDDFTNQTVRTWCSFGCNEAELQCNSCNPGTQECSGDSVVICDASGEIQNITNCGDPPATCVLGGCVACTPDAIECIDDVDRSGALVLCDAAGDITTTVECTYGCDGVAAICYDCYPGDIHCVGSDLVDCTIDGEITSTAPCPYGCTDFNGMNGACYACTPGPPGSSATECQATDLVECDSDGNIVAMVPCSAFGCNSAVDPVRCNECDPTEAFQCLGDLQTQCSPEGLVIDQFDCGPGNCNPIVGQCSTCAPANNFCALFGDIHFCNPDGTIGPVVQMCPYGCTEVVLGMPMCNECSPAPPSPADQCQGGDLVTCDANGTIVSMLTCPAGCAMGICL